MLLYVENKAFPHRTFTVRLQPYETIARVRAQLLHILYEIGKEDHQFRLRFKGQYLRDAYTIEDYGIVANAIIKMVPLSRRTDSFLDIRSLAGSETEFGPGPDSDVKDALLTEVKVFDQRERLLFDFKGLMYIHFLGIWFGFLTTYWYAGLWAGAVWIYGTYLCPTFTRTGGFIGKNSVYKIWFAIGYGTLAMLSIGAALYLGGTEWIRILNDGCKDWVFDGECSHQVVFSAMYFCIQALCFLVAGAVAWALLYNMKIDYGDYIEKHLVKTRDIEEVMKIARSGRRKEKRIAAFELATLAASGDDNKFRIVAEGGIEVLMRMSLSRDEATQEHAVEAIAELLTVPAIQDTFVEQGGVKTLSVLLRSTDARLVYEAATAISYIVTDSEENMHAVAADHGLEDLSHAAHNSTISCQRIIAGIFLELAFNSEIRVQMASLNTPAKALISLARSKDPDIQRYALQTLELLAIESSDMICAQEDLLDLLIELPWQVIDDKVYLLAGKILLYFAENRDTCEAMLEHPKIKGSLSHYARAKDPMLQKVVAKVIFCASEDQGLRYKAVRLQLEDVLKEIKGKATDRESWDMADQALQALLSTDELASLPAMTTVDKINKMEPQSKADMIKKEMGSRTSLRSFDKPGSSFE